MEERFRILDGAYGSAKADKIIDNVLASFLSDEWKRRAHDIVETARQSADARDRVILEVPVYINFDDKDGVADSTAQQSEHVQKEGYPQYRRQFASVGEAQRIVHDLIRIKIDYLEKEVIRPATDGDNQVVECAERRIRNLQRISDEMRETFKCHKDAESVEIYMPMKIVMANHLGRKSPEHGNRAMT